MIPPISFSSVVLPEPFRPTSPTASPGSTASETSESAQTSSPSPAAARDDQLLERARILRVDPKAARDLLDADLAGADHALEGTERARRTRPASTPTKRDRRSASRSARTRGPAPARARAASTSRSQRISRWSATKPTGHTSTRARPARAARAGGRGCPGRARARRSATRTGTRTTTRRAPARSATAARSRAAAPRSRRARIRAGRQCAVKTTCASVPRTPVGEQLDEPGLGSPALDERELRAAAERFLELPPVPRDRERRVVRREHEADDRRRAGLERLLDRVGDPRRPVLHPREHGDAELALERGARRLRDRVQRRVLDAEPPVPLDELREALRPDRAPAADVRVVRRHVLQALRRPVRHQHDRGGQTRTSVVSSCTSSRNRGRARPGRCRARRRGRG